MQLPTHACVTLARHEHAALWGAWIEGTQPTQHISGRQHGSGTTSSWLNYEACVPTASGIMRGAGRQLLASILNLISYWGLGLPLALLLGIRWGLGVQGLWWGLATTTSVQVGTHQPT